MRRLVAAALVTALSAASSLAAPAGAGESTTARAQGKPEIHAKCWTQFPLETSFDNYVESRLCVVKDLRDENRRYAFWKIWSPNEDHEVQVAARLFVKLKLNGEKVARTREFVTPTTPFDAQTKSVEDEYGLWCATLRERTPIGTERAMKSVCKRY
jgi:hypothetical protein